MTLRYTEFKDAENGGATTIAIKGLTEEELISVLPTGIIRKENEQLFVLNKTKPDGMKEEQVILNHQMIDPCTLCKSRVKKLTEGCGWRCNFEAIDGETRAIGTNLPLLHAYLTEQKAEKVATRSATIPGTSPFEKEIRISEISLNDETIEENKKTSSERAKKAVATKNFKKEHCASCIYSDEKNNCNHTHPTYCKLRDYETEEGMYQKTLAGISNRDQLLRLSLLCGNTIKYNRIRYRVSCVQNEVTNTFLLTRDYAPWGTVELTLAEILAIEPSWQSIVSSERVWEDVSEEDKNKHATTLALIRKNWSRISRIESWQNQHMFWASWNPHNNQVDIEIHLSQDTYRYAFKTPNELVQKAIYIQI